MTLRYVHAAAAGLVMLALASCGAPDTEEEVRSRYEDCISEMKDVSTEAAALTIKALCEDKAETEMAAIEAEKTRVEEEERVSARNAFFTVPSAPWRRVGQTAGIGTDYINESSIRRSGSEVRFEALTYAEDWDGGPAKLNQSVIAKCDEGTYGLESLAVESMDPKVSPQGREVITSVHYMSGSGSSLFEAVCGRKVGVEPIVGR